MRDPLRGGCEGVPTTCGGACDCAAISFHYCAPFRNPHSTVFAILIRRRNVFYLCRGRKISTRDFSKKKNILRAPLCVRVLHKI